MTYLSLAPHASLRALEDLFLYDRARDELYELNDEAWEFLASLDGETPGRADRADPGFLGYLRSEGLIEEYPFPRAVPVKIGRQPAPSLRYLELYMTGRCNLQCLHCFRGDASTRDIEVPLLQGLLEEFDRMGGLRLLLTGGEVLLHERFWDVHERLPDFGFRSVLLSNGTLLADVADRLRVDEVQVSLDGMEEAHDLIRGRGSFRRALAGLKAAADAGISISVATMVHRANMDDFEELAGLVRAHGACSWQVDVPTVTGRLEVHPDLAPDLVEAAWRMDYGFGGACHGGAPDQVCGHHLMAVFPDGSGAKCGFYPEATVGHVGEGLQTLFHRIPRARLSGLDCAGGERRCPVYAECRGGCRYRASFYNGDKAPDIVQCHRYGVDVQSSD